MNEAVIVDTCDRRKLAPLVVKIGGSLLAGSRLEGIVSIIARARRPVVIVPGGGVFADAVRHAQARHDTSDRAAHAMALLAMHQMGLMLEDMQPRLVAVETLASIRQALAHNRIPVWLPFRLAESDDSIPADWSVTSDALAARLAERLRFEGVLLVKSRCAARSASVDMLVAEGIVDPVFGEIVNRAELAFRIVGPGEERELSEICLVATGPTLPLRRLAGRRERVRRSVRRQTGTSHAPSRT